MCFANQQQIIWIISSDWLAVCTTNSLHFSIYIYMYDAHEILIDTYLVLLFVHFNLQRSMICQRYRLFAVHTPTHSRNNLAICPEVAIVRESLQTTIECVTSSKHTYILYIIYKITCYNTIKYWMQLAFERSVMELRVQVKSYFVVL